MSDSELTKYIELQDKVEELGKENEGLKKIRTTLTDMNKTIMDDLVEKNTIVSEQAEEIKRLTEQKDSIREYWFGEYKKLESDLVKAKEALEFVVEARGLKLTDIVADTIQKTIDEINQKAPVEQTKKTEEKEIFEAGFKRGLLEGRGVENQPEESKDPLIQGFDIEGHRKDWMNEAEKESKSWEGLNKR